MLDRATHKFITFLVALAGLTLGSDSKQREFDNAGRSLPLAHDDMSPIKELLA
jgi:hypothetical protein